MSNSYFHFKQFTIHQDRCAMKVSTDACIQGAWTPLVDNVRHVLDIGTGTGLLALMVAQRDVSLQVDALEIDEGAAAQAAENVLSSGWGDRIRIVHADAREFQPGHTYDLVICNPPFFNNSLLGDDEQRNRVRHGLTLSLPELFAVIRGVVSGKGYASVLLPVPEFEAWNKIVGDNGWHMFGMLQIIPREGMAANRVIGLCSKAPKDPVHDTLVIRDASNDYTEDFTYLLRPYYLKL